MAKGMSSQNRVKGAASPPQTLAEAFAAPDDGSGAPYPVHLWQPAYCGEMDLRICRDGVWLHEGRPIRRPAMVRLFARLLKREGDRYFLVTPVEKLGIEVEDLPFRALDVTPEGQGAAQRLVFATDLAGAVTAGPEHALIAAPEGGAPALHVRHGLCARLDRKTHYRLAELGTVGPHAGEDWFGYRSNGVFFPALPARLLD